jgi:hypothetical protein
MASTAFQSVTPIIPRILNIEYVASPLDQVMQATDPVTYRLTITAQSFKDTLPSGEAVSTLPLGISISLPSGISSQTAFKDYPINQPIQITMTDNITVLGGASILLPAVPVAGTNFSYSYATDKFHATLNMKSDITIVVTYDNTE